MADNKAKMCKGLGVFKFNWVTKKKPNNVNRLYGYLYSC